MKWQTGIRIVLVLWACWACPGTQAQQQAHIGELSSLDLQFMKQQREFLQELTALNLGEQFNGHRDHDLDLLQTLLDRKLVRPDQTRELQAMGVIMGDLLAAALDMHWVIYEDKEGRSRALRYQNSDDFLFPITMISRRREVGNQTSVADIYYKAYGIIAAGKPALPFQ